MPATTHWVPNVAASSEINSGRSNAGELTEILSQLEGPKMSISLCFNYELRNDSRIKAFKDFMIKEAEIIN